MNPLQFALVTWAAWYNMSYEVDAKRYSLFFERKEKITLSLLWSEPPVFVESPCFALPLPCTVYPCPTSFCPAHSALPHPATF